MIAFRVNGLPLIAVSFRYLQFNVNDDGWLEMFYSLNQVLSYFKLKTFTEFGFRKFINYFLFTTFACLRSSKLSITSIFNLSDKQMFVVLFIRTFHIYEACNMRQAMFLPSLWEMMILISHCFVFIDVFLFWKSMEIFS